MRTIKEEEISGLLRDRKVKPIDVFKSGRQESTPVEIDLEKKQVDTISSINELLHKTLQNNMDYEKKLIALVEKLVSGIESGSVGIKEELKASIGKVITTIDESIKVLKKSQTVPVAEKPNPKRWKFDIQRDSQGRIESVEAETKNE